MDKTVLLAKANGVLVGAHPSLPDRQGFGRREMIMDPVSDLSIFTRYISQYLASYASGRTCSMLHLPSRRALWVSRPS